jgi:hypothetical protein
MCIQMGMNRSREKAGGARGTVPVGLFVGRSLGERGASGRLALPLNNTNSERNLFFWMDGRRAAHFFLFPLYLSLSPRFQQVMG